MSNIVHTHVVATQFILSLNNLIKSGTMRVGLAP